MLHSDWIEDGTYRLVNDFGEPMLRDMEAFAVVSNAMPEVWISIRTADHDFNGPECFHVPGYCEEWCGLNFGTRKSFCHIIALNYPKVIPDLVPRRIRQTNANH